MMERDHHFYLDKLKAAINAATAQTQLDVDDIANALEFVVVDTETLMKALKARSACEKVVAEAQQPNSTVASMAPQKVQALVVIELLRTHLYSAPSRYEQPAWSTSS